MSGVSLIGMGVVTYGASRVGDMHVGWIAWPLATDGAHSTDRLVESRPAALRRAERMAVSTGDQVRPATEAEQRSFDPADYLRPGGPCGDINYWL